MPNANTSIYQFSISGLSGDTINFSDFSGKKILVVNTASECGYTPQYSQLQELYENFGEKLMVIGIPCNQFGGQEPGEAKEIASFCQKNYGVTFPLSEKIEVKGENQHEIYQFLTQKSQNGHSDSEVKWNFHKYLLNEQGELIHVFPSSVEPLSEEILSLLK